MLFGAISCLVHLTYEIDFSLFLNLSLFLPLFFHHHHHQLDVRRVGAPDYIECGVMVSRLGDDGSIVDTLQDSGVGIDREVRRHCMHF